MMTGSEAKQIPLLDEMEEVKRVFDCFDTNGDGKISLSELGDVLEALGTHTSPEELKQMMGEIDKDGDGFIDLEEFAEFHKGGMEMVKVGGPNGEPVIPELRDAFDMYDKDKNGLISASELHMVLKSLGEKCSVQDCSRMISSVDADGDGNVDFQEFTKMMTTKSQ